MNPCADCGYQNVPGTIFCEGCGNTLVATMATAATTATATATAMPAATARATGGMAAQAAATATSYPGAGTGTTVSTGSMVLGAVDDAQGAAESAPATLAKPYLVAETGRRLDVPLQDVVIVGREDMRSGIRPDVDLTLDGASAAGVSRRHCRLLLQPNGWYVEDLMSTNHTVLNGTALPAHTPTPLRDGDELRLGKLHLRFHVA